MCKNKRLDEIVPYKLYYRICIIDPNPIPFNILDIHHDLLMRLEKSLQRSSNVFAEHLFGLDAFGVVVYKFWILGVMLLPQKGRGRAVTFHSTPTHTLCVTVGLHYFFKGAVMAGSWHCFWGVLRINSNHPDQTVLLSCQTGLAKFKKNCLS